ncbi:hypothetical protein [Streptomyces alkaliterrae]|uniref:Uncharacterized protein n=1 Tax=Streptomyces alkaliterrae TaxID=2213162 RepID=A0A5P0YMA9_9ACTN|nr:hypothetical protein [Streptomyces alkaliterrae]MBB1252290.1 hypothetical protein [Streptomyces alkaliterrae]MBB1258091.1 hypothetical protein [Streptomyces alkaliterrae]MQS00552.1 hypothetical protein [Streptomyces alkaliterrae]
MSRSKRTAGVALAAGVLAASMLSAWPAAAAPATHSSPVGCWKAQAIEGDRPPADVEIRFNADRTLKLTGPRDEDGAPYFEGTGDWAPRAGGAFRFTVRHPLPFGTPAEARSSLEGALSSHRAFSASGLTHYHYDDGRVEGPSGIRMTGTRVSCG